jgi:hypothetical protein
VGRISATSRRIERTAIEETHIREVRKEEAVLDGIDHIQVVMQDAYTLGGVDVPYASRVVQ